MFQFFLMWASEPPTVASDPFRGQSLKNEEQKSSPLRYQGEAMLNTDTKTIYQTIVLPVQLVLNKESKDPVTLNE